jgi:hypothetical protein
MARPHLDKFEREISPLCVVEISICKDYSDNIIEVLSQEAPRHLYLTLQTSIDKRRRNGQRQSLRTMAAMIGETILMTILLPLLQYIKQRDFANQGKFHNRQALEAFRVRR